MARAQAKYTITAVDRTKAALKQIRRNFEKTNRQMVSMGRTMAMGLSAPIAAFGGFAIKAAGDFESSMNRVKAVSGATGKQFDALREQAKELGKTTQFSASEAADAMGFLAMAGFEASEVMGAMPSTLQLAAAAQMDLASAADITSNILTGYGMDVKDLAHANDVLVKTMTSANTDLVQMGEAMKSVAPIASSAGLQFEETAAAIGLLGNAGIQAGPAGRALKNVISSLLNPSQEAATAMGRLGLSAVDSAGNLKPLNEIVDQVGKSGATTGDLLTIFGKIAGPGMAALVDQGGDALRKLTRDLENSGGTAEEIANTQMEGLNGAIKKLKSAFEGLQIAIADSGLLTWLTNFVTKVAGWISTAATASSETMRLALTIAGIAAAVGPALLVLGKLGAGLAFLGTPMGMVITAVGLMVAAWARWGDDIKKIMRPVIEWVTEAFDELASFVLKVVSKILGSVSWLLEKLGKLPGKIGEDFRAMASSLSGWSDSLMETAEKIELADDGAATLKATIAGIQQFTAGAIEKIKGFVAGLGAAETETEALSMDLEELQGKILGSADGVVTLQHNLKGMGDTGKKSVNEIAEAADGAMKSMGDSIADAVMSGKGALQSLANTAKRIFSGILGGFFQMGINSILPGAGVIAGARASGGPVVAGGSYLVGENGPEIITPKQDGYVIPNGAGTTYNITINSTDIFTDKMTKRRVAEQIASEIEIVNSFHGGA